MRKFPKQARSRALVDSILDAAARVIASHGLAAATSARIADQAGISIGSLYQYFDSKEDIYAAVLDRMVQHLIMLVEQQTPTGDGFSLADWVTTLLNAVWEPAGGAQLVATRLCPRHGCA